jgi:hypothetical protein
MSLSGVAAVRRVAITLGLALCLVGCGAGSGEPVELLTGLTGCYAGGESSSGMNGVLVPDPSYGTSFGGMPVMWPMGFTGRHVGSEVEVLDPKGNVLATTGKTYHMSRAYVRTDEAQQMIGSVGAFPAAAGCGYAWDFMDCTAAASGTGEPIDANGNYTALGEAKLYCG